MTGGQGGAIVYVTNTNDSGPGSLRAALVRGGTRLVVCQVSGDIQLASRIIVTQGHVTIYGNGLTLHGESLYFSGGSNAVVHNLRVRLDADASSPSDADGISFVNWDGAIVDHCAIGWAIDENIGFSNSQNISIQNCILHEGLDDSSHPSGAHSMGTLINDDCTRVTFTRNLFVHHADRGPGISAENTLLKLEWVNNVVYNQRSNVGWLAPITAGVELNAIGNTYRRGPNTSGGAHRDSGIWLYLALTSAELQQTAADATRIYEADNLAENGAPYLLEYNPTGGAAQITYPAREGSPLVLSGTLTPMERSAAYAWVLANAGTLTRDSHEQRVVADVVNNTGAVIDDPSEVGG